MEHICWELADWNRKLWEKYWKWSENFQWGTFNTGSGINIAMSLNHIHCSSVQGNTQRPYFHSLPRFVCPESSNSYHGTVTIEPIVAFNQRSMSDAKGAKATDCCHYVVSSGLTFSWQFFHKIKLMSLKFWQRTIAIGRYFHWMVWSASAVIYVKSWLSSSCRSRWIRFTRICFFCWFTIVCCK